MEMYASVTCHEIRDQLKHRRYKFVISKVEKLLTGEQGGRSSLEFAASLFVYQLSAVNHLLERNLLKKYKYHSHMAGELTRTALRNITHAHSMLCELAQREQLQSLKDYDECKGRGTAFPPSKQLRELMRHFWNETNEAFLLIMQTEHTYKQEHSPATIAIVQELLEFEIRGVRGTMTQAKVGLYLAKVLSLSTCPQEHYKVEELVGRAIERLFDVLLSIQSRKSRLREESGQMKRYLKTEKEAYRLIVLAIVIDTRANMKVGREVKATTGTYIFKEILGALDKPHFFFKKLLMPQLYLQEQYLRYREQKFELSRITALFFTSQVVEARKQRQTDGAKTMLDFFNVKNNKIYQSWDKQRKEAPEASMARTKNTAKSMAMTEKRNSSMRARGGLLANMLATHTSEINQTYLKKQKETARRSMRPSCQIKPAEGKLKRQRLTAPAQKDKEMMSLGQLMEQERQDRHSLRKARDTFKKKSKQRLCVFPNPLEEVELPDKQNKKYQPIPVINRQSEQGEIMGFDDIDQRPVANFVALKGPKKATALINLLLRNKESLGIRRLAQKHELLRKRQDERVKMQNTRLTSSINRDYHNRHSLFQFEEIAKQILKKHMKFVKEGIDSPDKAVKVMSQRQRVRQASHQLGKRSIEHLKDKLNAKMQKHCSSIDKSTRREEIFKMKLKNLGSADFIWRKTHQAQARSEQPSEQSLQ